MLTAKEILLTYIDDRVHIPAKELDIEILDCGLAKLTVEKVMVTAPLHHRNPWLS
jgi:hypothetical protein